MAITLSKISEQCARDYARLSGRETVKVSEKILIKEYVIQAVHKLLSLTIKEAGGEIPSCVIATYTGETPLDEGAFKYVELPVEPLNLPLDQGVWEVSPDTPLAQPYIPFPSAYRTLLEGEDVSALEGQIGWVKEGKRLYFTDAPAGNVRIKLLVADRNLLEPDVSNPSLDIALPIPPEMESDVYDLVMEKLTRTGKSIE